MGILIKALFALMSSLAFYVENVKETVPPTQLPTPLVGDR